MIRLKRLYVNTASSFCIIIGFIGSSDIRRMLDGCFWGCASARNLWRKSLMKYGLWPEIIIFKKISTENTQQYVASGEGFFGDRIGDARHLNENL